MYNIPKQPWSKKDFSGAMDQAIAIELTTIPCYLSTYYSINRAQDQDQLYQKILGQIKDADKAKELTMDILLYSNKAAANIMSVVVEEMLHLSLSSNVKQASVSEPDIMTIGKNLTYPTSLFGHPDEFKINRAPFSIDQLISFLKIESPNHFEDAKTIGEFYDLVKHYINTNDIDYRLTKDGYPQLVPSQPYYAQNNIQTMYYDAGHNPVYPNADDSGGMIEVHDNDSALLAVNEIIHQGEGHHGSTKLEFMPNGNPKPLPVVDGKVIFNPEDYDDPDKMELSHFAKFMELYSLALHYQEKFGAIEGVDDFLSYFVYDQAVNPVTYDYDQSGVATLYQQSQFANAIYTYILLMIETCYYRELPTQFEVFMMGIHKSMIWLLAEFGRDMRSQSYTTASGTYDGSVTFEYYPFEDKPNVSPKQQLLDLAQELVAADSSYEWLFTDPAYLLSLPDVSLDYKVNKIPFTT